MLDRSGRYGANLVGFQRDHGGRATIKGQELDFIGETIPICVYHRPHLPSPLDSRPERG